MGVYTHLPPNTVLLALLLIRRHHLLGWLQVSLAERLRAAPLRIDAHAVSPCEPHQWSDFNQVLLGKNSAQRCRAGDYKTELTVSLN